MSDKKTLKISFVIFFFLLIGCESNIEATESIPVSTKNEIKDRCDLITEGMNILDAKEIMSGAAYLNTTRMDGNKISSGTTRYWKTAGTVDKDFDLFRTVVPNGVVCIVKYDKNEAVISASYTFVSEAEFQEVKQQFQKDPYQK